MVRKKKKVAKKKKRKPASRGKVLKKKKSGLGSIDDLRSAPYNPRKIRSKAAAGLGESLRRFGDISGIVWNLKTGNLVCGHQRVERLRQQGSKLKDGALETPTGVRWPVRVVDWSLEQEKAANITANNPHIAGEFTEELNDILADIKLSIGDGDFMGLRFDALDLVLPEVNLGDGTIDAKDTTRRFAVFVMAGDKTAKKELATLVESKGGHLAECSHENCNVSVRELDPNAWARRRDKLNPQAAALRKNRGSESQDSEGG